VSDPACERVARELQQRRLTMFVGAGASMLPPSCLPSWWQMSHAVLEALGAAAAPALGADAAQALVAGIKRREADGKLPPEFASDVLTYSMGAWYFQALACLDGVAPNRAHRWLAALAGARLLPAIVTTNFDTLIERACAEAGVAVRALVSPADYDGLDVAAHLADPAAPLLVVKVHGTATRPDTCVDTLAQRKRGPAPAVGRSLRALFGRTRLCVLGYSGADLDAEPNYLFLRQTASEGAPGLTWLCQAGTLPLPAVRALLDVYGPERGELVSALLPGWLDGLGPALAHAGTALVAPAPGAFDAGGDGDGAIAARRAQADALVREHAARWAAELGPSGAAIGLAQLAEVASLFAASRTARAELVAFCRRSEPGSRNLAVAELHLARSLRRAGDNAGASAARAAAFELFHRRADGTADLLFLAAGEEALALDEAGHFRQARTFHEHALDVAIRTGEADRVHEQRLALARAARALGDPDAAARFADEACAEAAALGDEAARACAEMLAGDILRDRGHFAPALERFRDAAAVFRRLGLDLYLVPSLLAEATVHVARAELTEATRCLDEAEALVHALEDVMLEATVARARAQAHLAAGRDGDAAALLRAAAARFQSIGDEDDRLACTVDLIPVLAAAGQLEDAAREGQAAIARAEALGLAPFVARLCDNTAIALEGLGRLDEAEALCWRAIATVRAAGDRPCEAQVLGNLGNAAYRRGDLDAAEARYRESLAIADAVAAPADRLRSMVNLANVLVLRGRGGEGRAAYAEAAALAESAGLLGVRLGALVSLAAAEWRDGDLTAAAARYATAQALAEALGDHPRAALAAFHRACVLIHAAHAAEAVPLLRRALAGDGGAAALPAPEAADARRMLADLTNKTP
jgi:tetratricopeptide (TPR) repeat protein